jgi:hypothetical protein
LEVGLSMAPLSQKSFLRQPHFVSFFLKGLE